VKFRTILVLAGLIIVACNKTANRPITAGVPATEKPAEKVSEKTTEKAAEKPAVKPAEKPATNPAEGTGRVMPEPRREQQASGEVKIAPTQAPEGTSIQLNKLATEAESKDPSAQDKEEQKTWEKLTRHIAEKGRVSQNQLGTYVSLIETNSNNQQEARTLSRISLIGSRSQDGKFSFARVEAALEVWKLTNDGNLDGDVWQFLISRDGNLAKVWHKQVLKTKDGSVLKNEDLEFTDIQADATWSAIKDHWLKKIANQVTEKSEEPLPEQPASDFFFGAP
jgi:hypothetical protein